MSGVSYTKHGFMISHRIQSKNVKPHENCVVTLNVLKKRKCQRSCAQHGKFHSCVYMSSSSEIELDATNNRIECSFFYFSLSTTTNLPIGFSSSHHNSFVYEDQEQQNHHTKIYILQQNAVALNSNTSTKIDYIKKTEYSKPKNTTNRNTFRHGTTVVFIVGANCCSSKES